MELHERRRPEPNVSVTYLLNKLQPLPFSAPLMLTLNPVTEPSPDEVIAEFDYAHPIFDGAQSPRSALADTQDGGRCGSPVPGPAMASTKTA